MKRMTFVLFAFAGALTAISSLSQLVIAKTAESSSLERQVLVELGKELPDGFRVVWKKDRPVVAMLSGKLDYNVALSPQQHAMRFVETYKELLGVHTPTVTLDYARTEPLPHGQIITLQQKQDGLDVFGGVIMVRIVDNTIRTVVNSTYPTIDASPLPDIVATEAVSTVRRVLGSTVTPSRSSLHILPLHGRAHLVWNLEFPLVFGPEPTRYQAMVDAHSGKLLALTNRIMHDGSAIGSGYGVDGQFKTFDSYELDGIYYLGNRIIPGKPATARTYSAANTRSLPGTIATDDDNLWDDPAAVDAHYYGNLVVDFFLNSFSDLSWFADSAFRASGGLVSTVHYDIDYDNAFWDGTQMVFGDGGILFYSTSGSLDVVAHEIMHGVTDSISALLYCNESGALSESWSDAMAMFIALDQESGQPYWLAEDIMKIKENPNYPYLYALRRMDDPPFRTDGYPENDYNPAAPLDSWGQPEHVDEQYQARCLPWTDNGGVHINSGIPNKAAYLINLSLGHEKTRQIYYLAMHYLGSNANFIDARMALEQAAFDLYGGGLELNAVQAAFNQVGIQ